MSEPDLLYEIRGNAAWLTLNRAERRNAISPEAIELLFDSLDKAEADDDVRAVVDEVIELYPDDDPVDDELRIMTDVVVGQILGTFKSMAVGLKPDAPSESGTINRVVQGVTIYARQGRRNRRLENTPGRDTRDRT